MFAQVRRWKLGTLLLAKRGEGSEEVLYAAFMLRAGKCQMLRLYVTRLLL